MKVFNFKSYVTKLLTFWGVVVCLIYYLQGAQTNTASYLSADDTASLYSNNRPAKNSTQIWTHQKISVPLKAKKASPSDGRFERTPKSRGKMKVQLQEEKVLEKNGSSSSLQVLAAPLPPEKGRPLNHLFPKRFELDLSRGAWAPWPRDPECRASTVHFGRHIPVRALASFPGSGNTWVRYLVEGATGLHTGSVYDDHELFVKGFRGEMERWDSGTTLLQKTHVHEDGEAARFEGRGVLILRNPYRAILAAHNFAVGGHRGYASVSNYRRRGWKIFVHNNLRHWLLIAKQWLTKGTSVHVLHYELLRENVTSSITDLLHHLGLPVDLHRLRCLQKHNTGAFHRESQYFPEGLAIFSPALRKLMDRAIRYVDCLLARRKLPRVPHHLYEFYNGTVSQAIVRKPCNDSLSQPQCDAAIDDLNRKRRKQSSKALASSSQLWPSLSGGGTGRAEDTRLTIKEWFFQHPVVVGMNEYFIDVLSSLRPDVLSHQKVEAPVEELMDEEVFEQANGICL